MATIAQSPLFRDHYMNVEYGLRQEAEVYRREIERMLADFSRRARVYPGITYLDAAGREVCSLLDGEPQPSRTGSRADTFYSALRGLAPGRVHASRSLRVPWHPAPVVLYGTPLHDEAGGFRGALVFASSLRPAYDELARLRGGPVQRLVLSEREGGGAEAVREARSSESVTAAAVVPGTPWSVIAVVSRKQLLEGLDVIGTITFLAGLLVSALVAMAIVRQVRAATRPIRRLADAAKDYAAGRWEARVPAEGPPEVAGLAAAFNEMADKLRDHTLDLEHRIRELTALSQMNEAVLRELGKRRIGRICLEAAVTGLGFDRGALYWVDEERGEIAGECVYGTEPAGFTDGDIRRRRVAVDGDDVLSHVVRERRAINVEDPARDPRCNAAWVEESKTRSFCLAPIIGRDRVLGIIGVDRFSGESISPAMARSLSLFCGAAGLALENAQLLEEIVRSEARYRTAVENSPDAVVSLDGGMRVTLWNRRAEALFGYQPSEAYGRALDFILEPEDYRRLKRQVETEGAVRHGEAVGLTRDGRRLDLNVSWTGQRAGGGVGEWFVVLQDVSEKKRLQAQLIQSEKTSAVAGLISGVAHELNNPLTAVIGFAELIKHDLSHAQTQEDLRLLYESALRCKDIVHGLLRFVRQEKPVLRRVPLNRVVEATAALYEYRLVKAELIKLEVDLDPEAPEIAGEFQKLQQILVNLLVNAADALKDWAGPRVVRLRTWAGPEGPVLIVEDTGPGVPERERKRIFEPFYTTKLPGKGTGLGLAISAQIAREFGGELRCEAGPGGGARFIAAFPPCPPSLPEAPAPAHIPPPVAGRRVLVVDDEPDLLQLMARLLREDGLDVSLAPGFADASRRLREASFDLVVADVELGQAQGTDLLAVVEDPARRPRFLFVTGDVLNDKLRTLLADWGLPYVTKPFLRTEFLKAVRKALREGCLEVS